jgi:hypothetical protein
MGETMMTLPEDPEVAAEIHMPNRPQGYSWCDSGIAATQQLRIIELQEEVKRLKKEILHLSAHWFSPQEVFEREQQLKTKLEK